jgi:hypothetical protein
MSKIKRTKIRFNLGRGVNYLKWKINHPNGVVEYLKPTDVQLVMTKCELVNNKKISKEIFNGAHKRICAWILCEKLHIKRSEFNQSDITGYNLMFNPRKEPNWVLNGVNVDGTKINKIESIDYKLYVI